MMAEHHSQKGGGENTNLQSIEYLNGLSPKILFWMITIEGAATIQYSIYNFFLTLHTPHLFLSAWSLNTILNNYS